MTMLQMVMMLVGIAVIVYGREIVPALLPLVRSGYRRATAIDPGWWSFGKGALLTVVLVLLVGRVHIPDVIGPFVPTPPPPPGPVVVVPGSGPMVLMVEETDARKSYTADQLNALDSTAPGSVREYCANHCAKIDGLPAVRVIDKDQIGKLDMEQPWVAAAAAQVDATKLPYVVMSNGKTGTKMPIENPSMILAALQRLEGGK